MKAITRYYQQEGLNAVEAAEQNEDSEDAECNIPFLRQKSRARGADIPDLCTESSLTLHLGLILSASLHSLCR